MTSRRDRSPQTMTGRGQGLVEFAFVVSVFLLILLGMFEFGFVFNHHVTLETATREGARGGAAMADGLIDDSSCLDSVSGLSRPFGPADVDPLIMAAVQRVLTSPGSMVDIGRISQIRIYEVTFSGTITGLGNVWQYRPGNPANPAIPCQWPTERLEFFPDQASATWPASTRTTGAAPDSVGVSISYTYLFRTPLGGIMRFVGGSGMSSLQIADETVMALQPTS